MFSRDILTAIHIVRAIHARPIDKTPQPDFDGFHAGLFYDAVRNASRIRSGAILARPNASGAK